jgi:hypothetical protein
MKNLIVLSVMVLSLSASAGELITLSKSSGFSPRPQSVKVTIEESGSIVRAIHTQGNLKKETLGKLSANAVQSLKDKIESIDDNAKPVDPNPKAPRCMDAPSSSITVNKGGKNILISSRASCHTSTVNDGNAVDLASLISSLDRL